MSRGCFHSESIISEIICIGLLGNTVLENEIVCVIPYHTDIKYTISRSTLLSTGHMLNDEDLLMIR